MMTNYKAKDYRVFEMFSEQWALVTAGTMERFNSCTLGWGSLGNIWGHDGKTCPIVTVYVHPARYTSEFLTENDTFTVSFYPESCRNALRYMGSHSGRDGDKAAAAGLTPAAMGNSVTYEEANLTFLCQGKYRAGDTAILCFRAKSVSGFQRRLAAAYYVYWRNNRRGR